MTTGLIALVAWAAGSAVGVASGASGPTGDGEVGAAISERTSSQPSPRLRLGLLWSQPEDGTTVLIDDGEIAPQDRPDAENIEEPPEELSEAVRARIGAEYLTDAERARLRIEHGAWTPADLADPVRAARAAVIVGAWDHPAVIGVGGDPLDRAEAAVRRGDADAALEMLGEVDAVRAERLRGEALETLGRFDEAIAAYERGEGGTTDEPESVRAGVALLRLRAPAGDAEAAHRGLLERIGRARDADRLDWRARLVEAELLYARHNRADAQAAARDALRLNNRSSGAMRVIGEISVDGFDFATAGRVADRIDAVASAGAERVLVTADAAAIRARAALRRRDSDDAEALLDPALARMPMHRELRAIEIAASAAAYRTASVERMLAEFDALSPGSSLALVWVGRTLSEARQYDLADGYLKRGIERSPHWSLPRLERGLMLVQAGEDTEALAELERALAMDPFEIRAQNSLTLVRELATYQTIETPHFVVRYKDGIDAALAPEMAAALELMHARVCSDAPGGVDHEPAKKTIVELMPNHEWFAVRIGGMPSIHTMAASTGPVIAIESPQVGPKFTVGPFDWRRVMQHEYTHTVNLSRTQNRVIHWMTEANAVFNEDAPRDMRTWRLLADAFERDGLFDLEQINIAFVRPEKPSDRSQAYAQGAWMFEYIVETWGAEKPRQIMDLSSAGRSASEAFDEALNETETSFLDGFKAWARTQLLAEGLILPEGAPDLVTLVGAAMEAAGLEGEAGGMPEESMIDGLLEAHPEHPELLDFKLGFALMNAGERLDEEQVNLLARVMQVRPADDAPHRRLARHYLAADSFEERVRAVEHLEFLDVREINSPAYAAELATIYAQLGRNAEAHAKAERASTIAPFNANQREQAARMALLAGDRAAAERHLVALTIIEPDRGVHQRRLEAVRKREP